MEIEFKLVSFNNVPIGATNVTRRRGDMGKKTTRLELVDEERVDQHQR
jgi:hypothetical protein